MTIEQWIAAKPGRRVEIFNHPSGLWMEIEASEPAPDMLNTLCEKAKCENVAALGSALDIVARRIEAASRRLEAIQKSKAPKTEKPMTMSQVLEFYDTDKRPS